MRDKGSEFLNEAEDANRSMYATIQALAETQFKILQRLADVQREQFRQALEAARDQLRLISQVRDPQEFASAQAELVKGYGQQYMDSINEAVNIMSGAWKQYGEQLEKGLTSGADVFRRMADTATRGAEEATSRAAKTTEKAAPSSKRS
jgi:predicted nucleic acid-binding protein